MAKQMAGMGEAQLARMQKNPQEFMQKSAPAAKKGKGKGKGNFRF